MTTNKPETLDKALIRPGRIDKQINMGYADQDVAANIFKRFYCEDGEHGAPTGASAHISELAQQFATKIPQLKLTPAEIQGFLIPLSDSPEDALVKTDKFVSDLLAAKAAGKNIIEQDWEEVAAD
jgi:chaperone BCS1